MRPIEAALEATLAELEAAQKTKPSGKTPDDLTEYNRRILESIYDLA